MDSDTLPAVGRFTPAWIDFFILIGAVALPVFVLFFWAVAFHKRRNRIRKYRHHHHYPRTTFREKFHERTGGIRELLRKYRTHHHHSHHHRHLNTTLAQTGGLPPLRSSDNPPGPPPGKPPT